MKTVIILVCALLFASSNGLALAEAAAPHQGHPLEVHGGHAGEAPVPRFCWLLVGATIAYGVYLAGETLRRWAAETWGTKPELAKLPKNGLQGIWQTPDESASIVFSEETSGKIHCLRGSQGFILVPDTFDPVHGIATGKVLCAAGGHEVGTFELRPAATEPNKFELIFNDNDVVGIFGRPD